MILERCLIHELVYHVKDDHICSSKADYSRTEPSTSSLTKERDDIVECMSIFGNEHVIGASDAILERDE